MENDIDVLFGKVAEIAISKREREMAAQKRGEKFNIFELLGLQTNETRLHSTLLAELLNPKGKHGLGNQPLKLFLIDICQNRLPNFDANNVIVEKEHFIANISADYNTGGRVDILIYDKVDNNDPTNAIIIENKINASDEYKQLYRYRNFAKDRFKNCIIFYLNLFGNTASQESEGSPEIDKLSLSDDYFTLSYKYDIIPWLKHCRALAIDKPYVRETLGLYINTLNSLTENIMNKAEKEEIFKYMEQHIEASAEIISASGGNEFCAYLIRKHIIPNLLEWANKHDLICHDSESFAYGNSCGGISFSKPEWKRSMTLQFQNKNFENLGYGITGDKTDKPNGLLCLGDLEQPNDIWPYGFAYMSQYRFLYPNSYVHINNGDVAKFYIMVLENLYQAITDSNIEM